MKRVAPFLFAFLILSIPHGARAGGADDLLGVYTPYGSTGDGGAGTPLDQPHLSQGEIAGWLSDAVADTLTFTPGHCAEKLADLKPRFSAQGYQDYIAFLGAYDLNNDIAEETLNMVGVVGAEPVPLGQGPQNGRYSWAFEMPVVLSILNPETRRTVTKNVTLRLQFSRTAPGLEIVRWQEYKRPNSGGKSTDTP